ncbi:MAG TPA: hypothetical protein PKA28_13415 [Methylomusa anaerophila]|uniref:Glycosyltransferase RgtA/B/C/D-like domain-containing protein n=1 Tax=Methylomusa anaerophila TaxID=1930071 RepID=A0A348AKN0_9FIRM|nr:hypothetical protein [Methylomusa anaerophila]BBB91628.1 hypothetical protein MAMMFC1_02312 [Methylomusa anaerophila]HML89434.1 hypothetical protein [Methylomusa anaerophila]
MKEVLAAATKRKDSRWGIILPVMTFITWLICILPSVYRASFGFLDDPVLVIQARDFLLGEAPLEPNIGLGRFQPVYKLGKVIPYLLWGASPAGFYFIQSLLVLLSGLIIVRLTYIFTGSAVAAGIAGVFFLTGSPVYETAYTLGKSEIPALMFFLLASFAAVSYLFRAEQQKSFAAALGVFAFSLGGVWTKETLMSIAAFGIAGAAMAYCLPSRERSWVYRWLHIAGLEIFAVFIARLVYYLLRPDYSPLYTTYSLEISGIWANFLYYLQQTPDVVFFGLASVFAMIIWHRLLTVEMTEGRIYSFAFALLNIGWVYFLGMLFWRWGNGYYVYIPSALFQMVFIISGYYVMRSARACRWLPALAAIAAIVVIIFKAYGLAYGYYAAISQRINDRMYYEAMQQYAAMAKPGERLLMEQWSFFEEPPQESQALMQQLWGKQAGVHGILTYFTGAVPTAEQAKTYLGQEKIDRYTLTPREGDYILFMPGRNPAYWSIRGIAPFQDEQSRVEKNKMNATLKAANQISAKCLILRNQIPFVAVDSVYRGYRLYQVGDVKHMTQWRGRSEDGWIAGEATAAIMPREGKPVVEFAVEVPQATVPQKLSIFAGNDLIAHETYTKAGKYKVLVPTDKLAGKDRLVELRFVVDKTFIPKDLGINEDTRRLGIMLTEIQ